MIERAIKIDRQVNKILNSYAMYRNDAKLSKVINLITRQFW